jgi:hypothetical protein
MTKTVVRVVSLLMILALITPFNVVSPVVSAQEESKQVFSKEELEQVLAPIALYPDSLIAQILMASTYPLEVVQAERWAKQNKDLKGDALTAALEKQQWDPSVKSLVNFPQVLAMMSEKLDITQRLGDAFLAQQKEVMDTIQILRKKAEAQGNLKTTKEQKVIVEKETQTIVIEPANPQVVYVPTYNPVVVYGAWPYPAYPPYPYYPPSYVPGAAVWGFAAGVAVGAAWGYAWGGCNWRGGDVDVNVMRNANINNNINRGNYARQQPAGGGNFQHNPEHRKGVSYRDQGTAQKYNRASTNDAVRSREDFRGRAEAGRGDLGRGDAGQVADRGRGDAGQFQGRQDGGRRDSGAQVADRQNAGGRDGAGQAGSRDLSGDSRGAFSGMDRGGSATRDASNRGSSSVQSMSTGSRGGDSSFGGGGGARGGGGSSGFGGGGSSGGRGGGSSGSFGGGGGGGGRGGGGGGGRR